ncbi:MAG TPA: alpha/beta hydrolase [Saprospiraceae bacterium]|nr:alpha/beta hydrolase [Saprospiraceae bacterium]
MNKILLIAIFALLISACKSTKLPKVTSMDQLNYGTEVKRMTLSDDIQLAYTEQGSGTPLLFIHGLGSYLPAWNKNVVSLSKNYECIAVDLPGYGHSSKGNYEGSMTFYAGVLKEFLEQKGIKRVVVAGHSMGGQIAMTMALQYPELVDKLILLAPAGFEVFNKGQRQWFRDVMTVDGVRLTTVEQIRNNYAYNFYNMPKDAQFMVDDRIAMRSADDFIPYCYMITKNVQGMVDQPIFDFMSKIKQPVLAIFGENDNLIPNRYLNGGRTRDLAEKGIAQFPNGKLVMIPKAGHFVQWEQADKVNKLISDFLK